MKAEPEKTDFKDLASRLAEYHGCRISRSHVRSGFGKPSMVFEFGCGNGFSFDTDAFVAGAVMPGRTLTYRQLVEKYLAKEVYILRKNDDMSEAWNEFPLKMIGASSPEELGLKLAALGY